MARRVKRQSREQRLMHVWWVRIVVAATFLGLAYGFASLAIDRGSWWYYGAAILLLWWGVAHIVRGVRFAFAH
jgi:hypothetical protein